MGKKQKKGHAGDVITYVTRARALRRLDISLKDFRRLCILKGIYPRDPKKKKNPHTTYYHAKDVAYLAMEPLLMHFRQMKSFLKKITRAHGRGEKSEARRRWESKPEMNVDHLVKERYPSFNTALADLDDALSLISLFSLFPAKKKIRASRTKRCESIMREWNLYVIHSHSLRKSFISIKGIYYQADVFGQKVTWLVPHKFAQNPPQSVDYKVMLTFLDFYEVFVSFVLYKLYASQGLKYPPTLSSTLDDSGAYMYSLSVQSLSSQPTVPTVTDETESAAEQSLATVPNTTIAQGSKTVMVKKTQVSDDRKKAKNVEEEEVDDDDDDDDVEMEGMNSDEMEEEEKESEARIASMKDQMRQLNTDQSYVPTPAPSASLPLSVLLKQKSEDQFELDEVFAEDEEAKQLMLKQQQLKQFLHLFRGLRFFISREVPREPVELIILAFSGEIGWEGSGSPYDIHDPSITHVIMDRPSVVDPITGRDYVQPQWLWDSVNNSIRLPIEKYIPGHILPPHLSPFVDNEAEGYTPEYQKEIDQLKSGKLGGEPTSEDNGEKEEEEGGDREDKDSKVKQFAKEIEMESRGITYSQSTTLTEGKSAEREEIASALSKNKENQARKREREENELKLSLANKKAKRMYHAIEQAENQKQRKIDNLKSKASATKKSKSK